MKTKDEIIKKRSEFIEYRDFNSENRKKFSEQSEEIRLIDRHNEFLQCQIELLTWILR